MRCSLFNVISAGEDAHCPLIIGIGNIYGYAIHAEAVDRESRMTFMSALRRDALQA